MEAVAKTKYLKGSPQKARLVIDLVRGQNVSKALAILQYTNKRAAGPIAKCIRSAIANATYKAEQENIAIDPDDLWVKRCFVDMGPTKNRRRLRPAPQGRAYFERRHYCHITIELTSDAIVDPSQEGPSEEQLAKIAEKKAKKAAEQKAEAKKKGAETKPEVVEETPTDAAPEVEAAAPEKESAKGAKEAKADEAVETSAEEKADEKTEEKSEEAPVEAKTDEKTEEKSEEVPVEEKADEKTEEKAEEAPAEDSNDDAADEASSDEEKPEDK